MWSKVVTETNKVELKLNPYNTTFTLYVINPYQLLSFETVTATFRTLRRELDHTKIVKTAKLLLILLYQLIHIHDR